MAVAMIITERSHVHLRANKSQNVFWRKVLPGAQGSAYLCVSLPRVSIVRFSVLLMKSLRVLS